MSYMPKNIDFTDNEAKRNEVKMDKLRYCERQFNRKLDDWHFKMVKYFDEPVKIFCLFKDARFQEDKIYFDGGETHGIVAFNFIKANYRFNLAKCFGNIEVLLAKGGEIVERFTTTEE